LSGSRRPSRARPGPWYRQDHRFAAVLALVALVVYNANGRVIATGDSRPARFLPFAILTSGTLRLDGFAEAMGGFPGGSYWVVPTRRGGTASAYPVVTPLLVAPLYIPAALYLHRAGRSELRLERVAAYMEKLAASLLTAVTVGLVYLLLRRACIRGDAFLLTVGYALGSNAWATSSQALWQHGAGALFLVVGLLAVTGARTPRDLVVAGLAAGLLAANRPPDVAFTLALAGFLLARERRRALLWATPLVVVLALLVAYNLDFFGRLTGGYGASGHDARFFGFSVSAGLLGLLLSPGKGLFFFTPFLAFVLLRLRWRRPTGGDALLDSSLALACGAQLLLYATTDFRAGWSYGPRFLLDAVPALLWLLAPVLPRLAVPARIVFVTALGVSTVVQAVGAFCYPGGASDASLESVWSLKRAPVLVEARAGLAPRDLVEALRDPGLLPGERWRRVEER
jgi:hypothetical protein